MTAVALDAPAPAAAPATRAFSAFEWMVAFRYLRARNAQRSISVIAGFSFLGIVLGVAALIVVMAVMNGFRHDLMDKMIGLNGHMFLQGVETPLTDYDAVAERVSRVPGVTLARRWSRARRSRAPPMARPARWCAAFADRISSAFQASPAT